MLASLGFVKYHVGLYAPCLDGDLPIALTSDFKNTDVKQKFKHMHVSGRVFTAII